jgi:alcohol dehydrogenase class IV
MKAFSIASPSRVVFGAGAVSELPAIVADLIVQGPSPKAVLVLSDRGVAGTGLPGRAAASLEAAGFAVRVADSVPPEPSDKDLDGIAASLGSSRAAAIVAIGGGSVMDAAKILSVLADSGSSTAQLAEKGVPRRGAPVVMVPTTAGTGSEATPNAIVLFPEKNLKVGIVSPHFIPERVLLDPELLLGLPPKLTASTGVDAFCHLLECFIGKKANPMSDMMAREGMRLLLPALGAAYRNGSDLEARSATMLAAYYGGACIAASGTNAVHALSYPLGGTYRIPHGVANAALLVPVMAFQRSRIAPRLAEAARAMGLASAGSDEADSKALVDRLRSLVGELGIPTSLAALGVPKDALGELTEAAYGVRRLLDNNPVELSREDIRAIYESVK